MQRKSAPQHVQKATGGGGFFTLPLKAAFGQTPPQTHGMRINTAQFSLAGPSNSRKAGSFVCTFSCRVSSIHLTEASSSSLRNKTVKDCLQKTSPPRISRGAGFVFKLPVLDDHQSNIAKVDGGSGTSGAEDPPDSSCRETARSIGSERAFVSLIAATRNYGLDNMDPFRDTAYCWRHACA